MTCLSSALPENTNHEMHHRPFFLQRIRYSANVYQFRLFWGLRLSLAFLLLLLALSPSLQAGSSPLAVKGIALLSLALLGLICFLDVKREPVSLKEVNEREAILPGKEIHGGPTKETKNTEVVSKNFRPFRIHSIVFEVNTLVEQQNLIRKTVDLFVLPDTLGKRFVTKAIARLKAAGYAIRPHSEPTTPEGIAATEASLIGVQDGTVHIFLGNR